MKQNTGRKLLGVLLALVLVLGLVPGMGLTAYADSTTWSANQNITATDSIDGGVKVTADIS